jgi:hypothetical protein
MEGISTAVPVRPFTVPVTELLRPQFNAGDKIALPVDNCTPWASFRYVQGVPAGAEGGYPVSKLLVLDTIIGSLVHLKEKSALGQVPADVGSLSDERIDGLIKELAGKLHVAANSVKPGIAESIGSSFGLAVSQTGTALNILA